MALGLVAGYQEWRRLLFLHWCVPIEALRPLVPESLSLDLYEGRAYVGLVPFVVQAARPPGVPRGIGLAFLETNVRTYVRVHVRHQPYPLHRVHILQMEDGLMAADGLAPPSGEPLIHFASGVNVEILAPRRRRVAGFLESLR